MTGLEISLLGQLRVMRNGQQLSELAYDKVWALLAYLAVEADRSWRREALAALLWPEQPDDDARHSLRQALTILRRAIGDRSDAVSYLSITRDTIGFNAASDAWLDLAAFNSLLDSCDRHAHRRIETCAPCAERMERAIALYRGDFLAGFSPNVGEQFDEWAGLQRERLRRRCLEALTRVAAFHEWHGAYEQARVAAARQLELDPWRESAHRQLMRVLGLMGERAAALVQYERCRQLLADELDVEPEAATKALYADIRRSEAVTLGGAFPHQMPAADLHNLPEPVTPFVGRSREREEIAERLANPACRLLTLTGPGGIGKTRLALRAARDQIGEFADGVFFVPLAPIGSVLFLVSAIADALSLPMPGHGDPKEQLINRLRDRELLLVLDNFEHLIAGADLIAELLTRVPRLTILVTSRERLNLQGEWVLAVDGMGVPRGEATDGFEGYGAVDLFVQCLHRSRPQVPLRPEERPAVIRICQLTEGMPLAIEMAAAWASVLTLPEIGQEMEQNFGFLTTSLRDVPAKHRSMRVVFDHSWAMLSEEEQAVFRRLSVFRGGCSRQAAIDLAGASLATLSALVAKSLLRVSPAGRYDLHELLRQYGVEKLAEDSRERWEAHERHCSYYLDFLKARELALVGAHQYAVLAEIDEELGNVRAAWQWATANGQAAKIGGAAQSLFLFHATTGRILEGAAMFERAVVALMPADSGGDAHSFDRDRALGVVLALSGGCECRLGRYDDAETLVDKGVALLRGLDVPRELGLALNLRAMVAHAKGEVAEEEALLRESLELSRAAGDDWVAAFSLNDLAIVAHLRGNDDEAQRLGMESLVLSGLVGDRRGQAFALHNLGVIAGDLGRYDEARQRLSASVALRRATGDQWGIASSLNQLGRVYLATGDSQEATTYLREALHTALDGGVLPIVAETLVQMAALSLLNEKQQPDRIRSMLTAVIAHPATSPWVRNEAAGILAKLGPPCSTETVLAPAASDAVLPIDELARLLLRPD